MQMTNFSQKYYPVIFILILLLYPQKASCQTSALDSLKASISKDENNLKKLKTQKEIITKLFNQINDKIYAIKLQNTGNLINNIKLNQYLKESNLYADSIDAINSLINNTLSSLNNKYHSVIKILDGVILIEQEKFKKATNSKWKIDIFSTIQNMDKERQKYLDKLNNNSTKMNIVTPLNIEPKDSFESVKLKIDILNDRIRFMDEEHYKLLERQNDLKSELSIYQDMLDFLAELRLNVDEEQDLYDRDQVNQLHYHIREINNELSDISVKLKNIAVEKNKSLDKLDKFNKYLNLLLKPSNK